MAIFEPPTIPDPVPHEQPRSPLTSSPYEALEHHELLQLIDELNDERARARFREGMWMAFFAHLVLFALLYFIPNLMFHGVKVISPTDAIRDHERDIALATPSDLANVTKSLDKNNRSAGRPKSAPQNNAPSQQMLRELAEQEAARKRLQQQQTPQPPAPQPQQQTPPPPQAKNEPLLPLPSAPRPQSALPDMPSPQSAPNQQSASNANSSDDQFNQQIRAAARAAMRGNKGGMTYGGSGGAGGHHGIAAGMGIISDTEGVNFDPWLQRLQYIIQRAWEPLIPESAYPPLSKQGVVGIRFTIDKDGTLEGNMVLETPSGDVALDKAAWGAIKGPQPFPPLPKEFHGKNIIIRGGFFYNTPPDQ